MESQRIVILGGGFGGVYTASYLDQIWGNDPAAQITLINRQNYFLMTPLLFEAGSGVLEPRHAVNPIRQMFSFARFVQADVERIDLAGKVVHALLAHDEVQEIPYDHLVIGLGGVTNTSMIPGSELAMTFKTLADAIALRNHVIQRFERADAESDEKERRRQLNFVIVGAGLVGTELMGELTDFIHHVARIYRRINPVDIQLHLIEGGPRIIPEFDEKQSAYAAKVLSKRGVKIYFSTRVKRIEAESVLLDNGTLIDASTIILAAGVSPNPVLATLDLPKDRKGRLLAENTMQVKGSSNVWAIGDCAIIPDPAGNPYPPLAQHAIREARTLADNITSAIRNRPLMPFVYQTQGSLAALGHFRGVGKVWGIPLRGFIAWWVWRTYYLFRMPRWERRFRIMIDWAVAVFFKNDIVQLDLYPGSHEKSRRQ